MIAVNKTDRLVFDLEMLQVDYNEQKKNTLRKEIADKYGVPLKNVEVNFVPITLNKDGEKISLTANIISNIQDPMFQQQLFADYIKMNEIENADLDMLFGIDNSVNVHVDFDSYSKFKSYKLKYLRWNNYLSYGPDNYYDFTKLQGLVLLNGYPENQCGKTTFAVDLLRFALFGKAKKSPTLDSVFNGYLPNATEVMVEAGLEIEGCDYVIRRTVTRPSLKKRTAKSKAKQKVEYYKLLNGEYELIENCEAESTTATNNIIREAVGTLEDYNLVISANASSLEQLIEMGQADKSRLFSKWLGLLSIEEKEGIAKDIYKSKINPHLLCNRYDKATLLTEVDTLKATIEQDEKEIVNIKKKIKESTAKIDGYNKEKTTTLAKKKEIKEELLKLDITTIEQSIQLQEQELTTKRGQLAGQKVDYEKIKDATFDNEAYKANREKVMKIENRKAELRVEVNHLKDDNKRIQRLIDNQTCPTCGQKIDVTMQNGLIEENNKKIHSCVEEGVRIKAEGEAVQATITEMEKQRENVSALNALKLQMTAVKAQIDTTKLTLENLKKQKEEVESIKENIRYNNDIDNKILIIDESIKVENGVKDHLLMDQHTYETDYNNCKKQLKEHDELIAKLTDEEKLTRHWSIYQQLLGKNGIIKLVLKEALPVINNEIARILSGLVDFSVELSITEDNKVGMEFIRNGVRFDLSYSSSGFETVMASLALRMALSLIGNMPKVNLLVLDEIIGPVGVSNFDNLRELFNRILTHYDIILHICHEPNAEEWHQSVITVTKQGDVSQIEDAA